MSKDKEIIEELTRAAQVKRFESELGAKAIVERSEIKQDERTAQLGEVLCDIGRDFGQTEPSLKGMRYLGSIAAHVYVAEATGTFANVKQIKATECPPELLMRLGEDLSKACISSTGRKAPKLRSGW
jgi:hypothetical protein